MAPSSRSRSVSSRSGQFTIRPPARTWCSPHTGYAWEARPLHQIFRDLLKFWKSAAFLLPSPLGGGRLRRLFRTRLDVDKLCSSLKLSRIELTTSHLPEVGSGAGISPN